MSKLQPFAQQAAQTHSQPLVQRCIRRVVALFEVTMAATYDRVQARDDYLQALPVIALGVPADFVLQLFQALTPWPALATLEVIPEKVKAAMFSGIDNPRLSPVQRQAGLRRPLLHHLQGCSG